MLFRSIEARQTRDLDGHRRTKVEKGAGEPFTGEDTAAEIGWEFHQQLYGEELELSAAATKDQTGGTDCERAVGLGVIRDDSPAP